MGVYMVMGISRSYIFGDRIPKSIYISPRAAFLPEQANLKRCMPKHVVIFHATPCNRLAVRRLGDQKPVCFCDVFLPEHRSQVLKVVPVKEGHSIDFMWQ
eukprot:scaffold82217_cov25-Tisochrysis_lutea.AAC.3